MQALLVTAGDGHQHARDQPAAALEGAGQKGQRADRDRAHHRLVHDHAHRPVVGQGREAGERRAGHGTVAGDAAVLLHVVGGQIRVAADEVVRQAEELDLLGRLELRGDPSVVVELAALARPLEHEGVGDAGVGGLAQERRQDREHPISGAASR